MKLPITLALGLVAAGLAPECEPAEPTEVTPTPTPMKALPDGDYQIKDYALVANDCRELPSSDEADGSRVTVGTREGSEWRTFDFRMNYTFVEARQQGLLLAGDTEQWVGDYWSDDGSDWCYGSASVAIDGEITGDSVATLTYTYSEVWAGDPDCLVFFDDCESTALLTLVASP